MKEKFADHNLRKSSLKRIEEANEILNQFADMGYVLTVRQLYYQFIGKDAFANTLQNYKNLVALMTRAREAGLVDWNHLVDRTRKLTSYREFQGPEDALHWVSGIYHIDTWEGQKYRPEIWVEKQALDEVVGRAARSVDVPYFSCRGYMSASAMYEARNRFERWNMFGYQPVIIHLGDHDPSGKQMTEDIDKRENELFGANVEIHRIALEMEQIKALNLPPNPAKVTDRRFAAYQKKYGNDSWELDALDPRYIHKLIIQTVETYMDRELFDAKVEQRDVERDELIQFSNDTHFLRECLSRKDEVEEFLGDV